MSGRKSMFAGVSVYVISLRDAEQRRRNMAGRLQELSVPFHFVDAIDFRDELPDTFDGARVERFGHVRSICCTLSHRLTHRRIVESAESCALILEDDVVLRPDFAQAVASGAKLDFDVLKFEGGRHHKRYVSVGHIENYSVEVGLVPSLGSAAYLITRGAADRFCGLKVIERPIDVAFADRRLSLRVLELSPFAAVQEHLLSNPIVEWHDEPLSFSAKLAYSLSKRWRILRAHGFGMLAAMEAARFRR